MTLLRGWPRILAVTLLAIALGAAYAFYLATPTYRASATLMLEPQEANVIDLAAVLPGLGRDKQILNTQVEVLKSRALLAGVADRQNLVSDPEFNAAIRPPARFGGTRVEAAVRDMFGLPPMAFPPLPPLAQQRQAVIARLLQVMDVRVEPESLVLNISITTTEREKSARLLHDLTDAYVAGQLSDKRSATEDATRWLTERVVELKATLEAAEGRAHAARSEMGLASPETLAELERQLAALRIRQAETLPGSAAAVRLDTRIASVADEIRAASEDQVILAQLEREAEASALLYETFLARLKETSLQSGVERPDVRILSPAVAPARQHRPNPPLVMALAMILGAGLGAGWVLGREEWQVRFRSAEEAEQATGLPVLATLFEEPDRRRDPVAELSRKPNAPAAEALRTLRSSILLSNIDAPPQVIAVTSSVAEEGKSITALMLAETLAGWGKTVLVIEADIRAASYHARFNLPESRGLLSVIAGLCPLAAAKVTPAGHGFDLIPAETTAAHAADVFATSRFNRFLRDVRERYDYVLIDTPPVLAAADARVIAAASDAVVYLVRWKKTSRSQLRRGLAQFRTFGQPLTGVVLSRARPGRLASYASRGR